MEGGFISRDGGTRPGVATEMKRILVPLSFVFVFEAIMTVSTLVLLFHHVHPAMKVVRKCRGGWGGGMEREDGLVVP